VFIIPLGPNMVLPLSLSLPSCPLVHEYMRPSVWTLSYTLMGMKGRHIISYS
jgi:hypothetical protein